MDLVQNGGVRKESIGDEVEVRPGACCWDQNPGGTIYLYGLATYKRTNINIEYKHYNIIKNVNTKYKH